MTESSIFEKHDKVVYQGGKDESSIDEFKEKLS